MFDCCFTYSGWCGLIDVFMLWLLMLFLLCELCVCRLLLFVCVCLFVVVVVVDCRMCSNCGCCYGKYGACCCLNVCVFVVVAVVVVCMMRLGCGKRC